MWKSETSNLLLSTIEDIGQITSRASLINCPDNSDKRQNVSKLIKIYADPNTHIIVLCTKRLFSVRLWMG